MLRPRRRATVSSVPKTTVAPEGTTHVISHPNRIWRPRRAAQVARFNTRGELVQWRSIAKPMTRQAAVTVRGPGVRIAPKSQTCAWTHPRSEKSGAHAAKLRMIASGRGGIMGCPPAIAGTLGELIYRQGQLASLPTQKWPKSSKGLIVLLAYTPFDAHQFGRAAHSNNDTLLALNFRDARIELSTTVIVIAEVLENVVHGAIDQLACDGQTLCHPEIMLHLFDEQKTRVQILARVVATGVIAVIIEHVHWDVLLRQKIE
jgi:hypothetical protein